MEDSNIINKMVAASPPIGKSVTEVIDVVLDIALLALETNTIAMIDINSQIEIFIYKPFVDPGNSIRLIYGNNDNHKHGYNKKPKEFKYIDRKLEMDLEIMHKYTDFSMESEIIKNSDFFPMEDFL